MITYLLISIVITLQAFVLYRLQTQPKPLNKDQKALMFQEQLSPLFSQNTKEIRDQLELLMRQQINFQGEQFQKIMQLTDQQLKQISGQVDRRLGEGFAKTSEVFNNVIKRLAEIDTAQKRIQELSSDIISLKDILNDKKARGTFGEIQLHQLIKNTIPEKHFKLQATLSNQKRADCLLLLPEPTGNIVIDAKFPLENYRRLQETPDDARLKTQFSQDIKKHIKDIAEKYIIQGETAESAILFIPAESIFAQIHSQLPELVEYSQSQRIWLTSPSTLMAILTTAMAVIKDVETREQVHLIQKHIQMLSADFQRFQKRMNDLARHVQLAYQDIDLVHKSSSKITQRFEKIEKVDFSYETIE
ncbi:MAG: DNA recombination protein RmuC [Pseudomonadota bacterium]|nr:DNA recombination protein RmuC [Pseudomonadota bacterium]